MPVNLKYISCQNDILGTLYVGIDDSSKINIAYLMKPNSNKESLFPVANSRQYRTVEKSERCDIIKNMVRQMRLAEINDEFEATRTNK